MIIPALIWLSTFALAQEAPEPPEAETESPVEEVAPEEDGKKKVPRKPAAEGSSSKSGIGTLAGFEPSSAFFRARVAFGAGPVYERELGGNSALAFDVKASVEPHRLLRVELGFSDYFYTQSYLSKNPAAEGDGYQQVSLSEQFQNLGLGVSTNLLGLPPFEALDRHAELRVTFDPVRYIHLANTLIGSWSYGMRLALEASLHPAPRFYFVGGAGVTPRLGGNKETLSVMGRPLFFSDYRAGLGYHFGEKPYWSVELHWKADSIVFQHTHRMIHTGRIGLEFAY